MERAQKDFEKSDWDKSSRNIAKGTTDRAIDYLNQ